MRLNFHTGDLSKVLKSINCLPTPSVPTCDQYLKIHADEFEGVTLSRTGQNGRVTFDCPAEVAESGTIIVGFGIFFRLIGAMPKGMINVETKGSKLLVKGAGGQRFEQPVIEEADAGIPNLVLPAVTSFFSLPSAKLCDYLKRCVVAVRTDANDVDMLGGVTFRSIGGKLVILATDRRRIHQYDTGIDADGIDAMLPAPMVDAVRGMFGSEPGNLLVEFDDRSIQFAAGGNRYVAPRSSKSAPNLTQVVALAATPEKRSEFDRETMMEAVKSAMPLSVGAGEMRKLSLRFLEDGVEVSSEANGAKFEQKVPAKGDEFYIEVNAGYFEEWLEAAYTGAMSIGYRSENIAIFCQTAEYTLFLSTLRPDA